jgi:hypothetical protein
MTLFTCIATNKLYHFAYLCNIIIYIFSVSKTIHLTQSYVHVALVEYASYDFT